MLHQKATTTYQPQSDTSEAAIFGRLFETRNGSFSQELARAILEVAFSETDQTRMEELAQKNQRGLLTPKEREELRNYVKVGDLLAILHSKARQVLKKHKPTRRKHD
jgi:hypothetical protein